MFFWLVTELVITLDCAEMDIRKMYRQCREFSTEV